MWLWNEVGELLFGRLPRCRSLANVWAAITEKAGILVSSKDALLDAADPLPFLGLHYMQVWLAGFGCRVLEGETSAGRGRQCCSWVFDLHARGCWPLQLALGLHFRNKGFW